MVIYPLEASACHRGCNLWASAATCPCLPLAVAPFHNTSCPTTPSAALCWVRSDPDSVSSSAVPTSPTIYTVSAFMSFHPYTLSREPSRPAASSLHSSLLRPFLLLCSGSSTSLHSVSFLFVPASPVSSSLLHCDCEHSRRWSLSEAELHRLRCSCGEEWASSFSPKEQQRITKLGTTPFECLCPQEPAQLLPHRRLYAAVSIRSSNPRK